MELKLRHMAALLASLLLALQVCLSPLVAFAADAVPAQATVSSEGDAAVLDGCAFGLSDFARAQKGSNSGVLNADGETETYYGYRYYISASAGSAVVIGMNGYAVAYVPDSALQSFGVSIADQSAADSLKALMLGLDSQNSSGGQPLSADETWYFTNQQEYAVNGITFKFDQELKKGQFYACVIGTDGSDITDNSNPLFDKPSFADSARVVAAADANIASSKEGFDAVVDFLVTLDWSPLWVSLRSTGIAIVLIFVLGLAAAYFTLNISPRAQNIFDSIFTIPMVLPPTVCGFVLLYLCGSKTPFGQFFIDVGFPLIFSPAAVVIASTVVAFPLMYRNSRGAFENLDPNMLDAARTLGWSNAKIFFRLMLPLSWSSIAAATVLAFARALGEFGATLFLAGNYLGVTRTIPIAIYFEWMNGNDAVAWFWTGVIIVISFIVIMFVNLWSKRTTRYRKGVKE